MSFTTLRGQKIGFNSCESINIFIHRKLPYITCLREAHRYSVAMRKHFFFAFVPFFLLQLKFFPLRLHHQRSTNKIRPDGAPSFTGNHYWLVFLSNSMQASCDWKQLRQIHTTHNENGQKMPSKSLNYRYNTTKLCNKLHSAQSQKSTRKLRKTTRTPNETQKHYGKQWVAPLSDHCSCRRDIVRDTNRNHTGRDSSEKLLASVIHRVCFPMMCPSHISQWQGLRVRVI